MTSKETGVAQTRQTPPKRGVPPTKITVPIRHGKTIFKVGKYIIFSALIVDMLLFLFGATLNEALDSIGWLLLLGTFEYESTSLNEEYVGPWEKYLLMAVQTLGYGIALKVTVTYGLEHDWMDVANSTLWLLVCATIAYDIYAPGEFGSAEWRIRNAVKMALYMALVAVAVTWGVEEQWLDFFDASLWIICFAVVELNIFEFEETEDPELSSA